MKYTERLRRLAIHDVSVADDRLDDVDVEPGQLEPKTVELVRLAALVAVGGKVPSFGVHTDAAVTAGASADEIVDVLFGIIPVVGLPRVVAAAPELAMALGYDLEGVEEGNEPPR